MKEHVKDVTSAEEARAEIFRMSFYEPLVHKVMMAADHSGINSEDRYTLLVYELMKQNVILTEMLEETLRVMPVSAKL